MLDQSDADLLEKIETLLPKLDGIKSPLQCLAMADCLIRLLLLSQQDKSSPIGLKKPKKRERAAYFRAYRLRVKAAKAAGHSL